MPKVILLLEDEEAAVAVLSRFFEQKGFLVFAEESPEAALRLIQGIEVDLIIVDVCLPEGDGLEFLRDLRNIENAPPALVLTGLGWDDELACEARHLGAAGFYSKLVSFTELNSKIEEILGMANPT